MLSKSPRRKRRRKSEGYSGLSRAVVAAGFCRVPGRCRAQGDCGAGRARGCSALGGPRVRCGRGQRDLRFRVPPLEHWWADLKLYRGGGGGTWSGPVGTESRVGVREKCGKNGQDATGRTLGPKGYLMHPCRAPTARSAVRLCPRGPSILAGVVSMRATGARGNTRQRSEWPPEGVQFLP